MFSHLVVPVDDSSTSLSAVRIAADLTAAVDGTYEVIMVIDRRDEAAAWRDELAIRIAGLGPLPVQPVVIVRAGRSVADLIADRLEATTGAMVLMSSHGHGRSAAVLGSTTDEVLRASFGPMIVIGPRALTEDATLGGVLVVPLDGSERADGVLPIAAAWAVEFGATPWLVEVIDPLHLLPEDVADSGIVRRRASDLAHTIGRDVPFEALHDGDPARAIVDFAEHGDASMIAMATHGRTGMARLRAGSVASDVVRHATCPVLLFRPPELGADVVPLMASRAERGWARGRSSSSARRGP